MFAETSVLENPSIIVCEIKNSIFLRIPEKNHRFHGSDIGGKNRKRIIQNLAYSSSQQTLANSIITDIFFRRVKNWGIITSVNPKRPKPCTGNLINKSYINRVIGESDLNIKKIYFLRFS